MKAIPTKGRLTGKRNYGYLPAAPGSGWMKKGNYSQLEDQKLVTAILGSSSGGLWVRCEGATCEGKLKRPTGKVLGTAVLGLPGGRK